MSAQNQNALIVARGQVEQYKFELQKNRIMVRIEFSCSGIRI